MGGYIYGAYRVGSGGQPIEFAKEVELPEGVPNWGRGFRGFISETFSHYYQVHALLTDPPLRTNFVDLDPHYKNANGLPLPRITFSWSPQIKHMHQFFYQKMIEILNAAGAKKIWGGLEVRSPWYMTHPSGGTRMGEDPKESVTDRYGKIHGIDNLFVSGSSLFPTISAYNVTQTIGAVAYWQSDYIKQKILKGNLI